MAKLRLRISQQNDTVWNRLFNSLVQELRSMYSRVSNPSQSKSTDLLRIRTSTKQC